MILLSFPCDIDIARLFCRKIGAVDFAALILQKQERLYKDILKSFGAKKIFVLDEDFYGRISSSAARKILDEIKKLDLEHIYFPINDFCGNAALFLSIFSDNVSALNAASDIPVRLDLQRKKFKISDFYNTNNKQTAENIQSKIAGILNKNLPLIEKVFAGEVSGERPTTGIASGMPYDCEVLSRYLHAGEKVKGSLLEIGCGLGYGAFSIAEFNKDVEITAIDYDSKAIDIANKLWRSNKRAVFKASQALSLPFEDESFDNIVCFEVIEHVDNPELLLDEIYRVLKKGGRLIGSTPNYKLYPFKTNKNRMFDGTPEELRRMGIWPWHIQEFDEDSIKDILIKTGFKADGFKYPTFVKGVSMLETMSSMGFEDKVEYLSKNLTWSTADFAALDEYYPLFSGCSFIFEAGKV